MEYTEDEYLMISGIQAFQILPKTMGIDSMWSSSGLKTYIPSRVN